MRTLWLFLHWSTVSPTVVRSIWKKLFLLADLRRPPGSLVPTSSAWDAKVKMSWAYSPVWLA